MSFQFQPPELGPSAEGAIRDGWRALLTLGPDHDPFWQQVRARQLGFLDRYLPMNIPIALVNGAIVIAMLADIIDPAILFVWGATQLGSILFGLWQRLSGRRDPNAPSASRAELRTALVQLFLVGAGWALIFAQALERASPDQAMLVVAMTMAGLGCLAFSTAIWPLGSLAMSGTVAVGTIFGLFARDWNDAWPATIVLVSFMLFIARGNVLTARAFLSRLRMQERLQTQEEVVRLLLTEFEANGSEWLYEFDVNGCLTFASSRFAAACGQPIEAVIGHHWTRFFPDQESALPFHEIVRRGQPYRDVVMPTQVNGEIRWWQLSGTPKFDREGRLIGYRGVGSDVTERQRASERIAELATFDALTGLVNRRIIHQALADGLSEAGGVGLLFVDLDRFKAVNDSLGHSAGDRLLAEVALRLRDAVAESAGPRALVGRLGGDEFAVVLRGNDRADAIATGNRLIAALSRPYSLGGTLAEIGASVGLAWGPEDGETVEALMRAADMALYDVKGRGRGTVRAYDRALHARAEDRRALELDLRNAKSAGQLWLAFQPVVDSMDERIVGFEALMRWRHPTRGDVPPSLFIPLAEEAGLIADIGAWALNEACRTAAAWPRHIRLAVNVSPAQFDDPAFVDRVHQTLARWHIAPHRLELELTESLFLDERPQTSEMLARLREMGIGFALDDFGTGYSSLGYLRKVAFSRIKIDRSFVRASAAEGSEAVAIVQAIVALAERLGMTTTAEGTETRAEFEAMRRLGCAQVQGYYFGRPMPAEDVARLLDRSRPLVRLDEAPPAQPRDPLPVTRRRPRREAASGRSPAAAAPATALRP
ncbi:MAG: putative bifunctional diguanylate cyclase/phosphodiesterase [Sphingomonadaceae bacterium]